MRLANISPKQSTKSYDSGLHHVRKILWRTPSGWCWNADVEKDMGQFADRFRKGVIVRLYNDGKYSIDLTSGGFLQGLPRKQADKGNC